MGLAASSDVCARGKRGPLPGVQALDVPGTVLTVSHISLILIGPLRIRKPRLREINSRL